MTVLEYVETLSPAAKEAVTITRVATSLNITYDQSQDKLEQIKKERKCIKEYAAICPMCGLMLCKVDFKNKQSVYATCYGCECDITISHEDCVPVYNFKAATDA